MFIGLINILQSYTNSGDLPMTVYVLWHIHKLNDDHGPHDEEKLNIPRS